MTENLNAENLKRILNHAVKEKELDELIKNPKGYFAKHGVDLSNPVWIEFFQKLCYSDLESWEKIQRQMDGPGVENGPREM